MENWGRGVKHVNLCDSKSFWRFQTACQYVRGAGVFIGSYLLACSHLSKFYSETHHFKMYKKNLNINNYSLIRNI